MATKYDYINEFAHKCNWWENAPWEDLTDGNLKVLSHLHFEDLRRRIHLLRYPWSGFRTLQESFQSWWEVKWAYGNGDYPDNTYHDENSGLIITLEAGEYRWDTGEMSGGYPYMQNRNKETKRRAGTLFCWDGDFYASETGEYIPAQLFVNDDFLNSETGFTNLHSSTPPLLRTTGELSRAKESRRWEKYPWFGFYHDWDVNSGCKVIKRLKIEQYDNPERYQIDIDAYRWLPLMTDATEIHAPIHCSNGDNDMFIWQYRDKVIPVKKTITDAVGQGPNAEGESVNVGLIQSSAGNFKQVGYVPWPRQNMIAKYSGHPDSSNGGEKIGEVGDKTEGPYAEPKFSDSYQAAVELNVERAGWMFEVDAEFKSNFMLIWNQKQPDGSYPYETKQGIWNPRIYDFQRQYVPLTDEMWGQNAVGYELLLKYLGHYDWYWDVASPFVHHVVTKVRATLEASWIRNWDELEPQYPLPVGCWRKIWQYSMGLRGAHNPGTRFWPGELGPPSVEMGYIAGDYRMAVEQRHYDVVDPQFLKYYRVVDVVALEDAYNAAFGSYPEDTEFGKYGSGSDVTNTTQGKNFVINNFTPGTETTTDSSWDDPEAQLPAEYFLVKHHHPYQYLYDAEFNPDDPSDADITARYQKYRINPLMLTDMRNVMLMCRYHTIDAGVGMKQQTVRPYGNPGNNPVFEDPGGEPTGKKFHAAVSKGMDDAKAFPSNNKDYYAHRNDLYVHWRDPYADLFNWGLYGSTYGVSHLHIGSRMSIDHGATPGGAAYVSDGAIIIYGGRNTMSPTHVDFQDFVPGTTILVRIGYVMQHDNGVEIGCAVGFRGATLTGTSIHQYEFFELGLPPHNEDVWYPLADRTGYIYLSDRPHMGLVTGTAITVSGNAELLWSWDWDSVPRSVFARGVWPHHEWENPSVPCQDVAEAHYGKLPNVSPETWHPELDTNNDNTPNWHENPEIKRERDYK